MSGEIGHTLSDFHVQIVQHGQCLFHWHFVGIGMHLDSKDTMFCSTEVLAVNVFPPLALMFRFPTLNATVAITKLALAMPFVPHIG